MKAEGRLYAENINKYGTKMMVIEYRKSNDITVEFEDGYKKDTTWRNFKMGNVTSIYDKTVHGVGYLGSEVKDKSYRDCKIHNLWSNLLQRCYKDNSVNRSHVYEDCEVTKEWFNFQNFKAWYLDNYYEVDNEKMNLDKDILCKGNRIYSPDQCIFVPKEINTLFIKSDRIRGKYPLGVHLNTESRKYKAQCKTHNKVNMLGYFDCPKEAFLAYKVFKENYIKEMANKYKNKIPEKLYVAMLNYEVEITD